MKPSPFFTLSYKPDLIIMYELLYIRLHVGCGITSGGVLFRAPILTLRFF